MLTTGRFYTEVREMRVSGWNNGSPNNTTGAGYGVRISSFSDRDKYFKRDWDKVLIELEGNGEIEVNISQSFWSGCCELRSAKIGSWMIKNNLAPWPKGIPPHLELQPLGGRRFKLKF